MPVVRELLQGVPSVGGFSAKIRGVPGIDLEAVCAAQAPTEPESGGEGNRGIEPDGLYGEAGRANSNYLDLVTAN